MYNTLLGHSVLETVYSDGKGVIKQVNQYKKICVLGEGTFSKVFLAIDENSGKYYAVKRINLKSFIRTSVGIRQLEREIEIMREIKSKYVVQLHEVIYSDDKGMVYLVVDYADCGSLEQAINAKADFTDQEIKSIFKQIALGVKNLHDHNVVHQDLKPANILLKSDGTALISDLGIGRSFQSAAMVVGTPAYQSPEVVDDSCEDEEEDIDPCKEDVWSLGVTLYQLAYKKLPFTGCNVFEIVRAIESSVLERPECAKDDDLWDLIKNMLVVSPSKRYSIYDVLEHKYTKSADIDHAPKCVPYKIPEIDSNIPIVKLSGIVCDSNYSFAAKGIKSRPSLPNFTAPFR